MKKEIFIVSGRPNTGKDEFVKILRKTLATPVELVKTSDLGKKAAVLLGWDGGMSPAARRAISDIIDLSNLYFNGTMKYVKRTVNEYLRNTEESKVVVIHAREIPHIAELVNAYPLARTVLLKRDDHGAITNHADRDCQMWPYHFEIENNGTLEEFHEQVLSFYSGLNLEF